MQLTMEALLDNTRISVAVPLVTLALGVAYLIWAAIYNVFFHPLRNYPGPKLWAISRIPHSRMIVSGRSHRKTLELHREYGPVVRVAPDELSYSHPDAWTEIAGHRKGGASEHGKDPGFFKLHQQSIIGANRENHARFRKALSHAFSAQVMQNQQEIIKQYVDLLFSNLRERCAGGSQPLNIVSWLNWTTFDLIGDLAFGEPFDCLAKTDYHPWVDLIFENIQNLVWRMVMRRFPVFESLLVHLIPQKIKNKREQHFQLSQEKVKKRLAAETERPDFMDSMVRRKGGEQLSFEELCANSATLIVAGSETTATLLSAATFYLAQNPAVQAKLAKEVRSTFKAEDEIDLLSTQNLAYMLAVLDESLRMFPPVPGGMPRKIAKGGDTILGQHVPEDTIVQTWQWAIYRSEEHFVLANSFIPERWLGDPRFARDRKEAFQPFSVGPRNCIGKNLAYAEMRLILARLVWNFDIGLAEDSTDWAESSEAFVLWKKGPLNVYLTPVRWEDGR